MQMYFTTYEQVKRNIKIKEEKAVRIKSEQLEELR